MRARARGQISIAGLTVLALVYQWLTDPERAARNARFQRLREAEANAAAGRTKRAHPQDASAKGGCTASCAACMRRRSRAATSRASHSSRFVWDLCGWILRGCAFLCEAVVV